MTSFRSIENHTESLATAERFGGRPPGVPSPSGDVTARGLRDDDVFRFYRGAEVPTTTMRCGDDDSTGLVRASETFRTVRRADS